jgi:hypothetical protein
MNRAVARRLDKLEAEMAPTGPIYITSSVPLPDDPTERREKIEELRRAGLVHVHGRWMHISCGRMTAEEWLAEFSPLRRQQ